jgi:hypothetical protein
LDCCVVSKRELCLGLEMWLEVGVGTEFGFESIANRTGVFSCYIREWSVLDIIMSVGERDAERIMV